jgi:ribosomal protein S18 acetylase RimI-like enzyme
LSTSTNIRAATPDDLPALLEVIAQLNQQEGNDVTLDKQRLHAAFFQSQHGMRMHIDIAETRGLLCAFVLYYWGYDLASMCHGVHVADICVDASGRRHGVGTALFRHVIARCLNEGGAWVSLTCSLENTPAQAFYQRCGMQQIDTYFYAMGKTAMAKLLASGT